RVPPRRAQRRRADGVQPPRPTRRPAREPATALALGDRLPLGLTRNFPPRARFCWGRASNLRRRRLDARTPRASAQRDRTFLATSDARTRGSFAVAATTAATLCCLLAALLGTGVAAAATAGGVASPGASGAPKAGAPVTTTRAPPARPATKTSLASRHVTSVRITNVSCVPTSKCSGNPRQVSVRGLLLFTGRGLRAGMTV